MAKTGAKNLITDIKGIKIGNASDLDAQTGVTLLVCDDAYVCAVDVRGGGPGTRETDVLALENLVGKVDAICLSGGSVFGLAAADEVAILLSSKGQGLKVYDNTPPIPIVSSAVIFDINNQGNKNWGNNPPYRQLGRQAFDALDLDFKQGNIGAGLGAMAGNLKGGLGSCSLDLGNGLIVGALVVSNPVGSVKIPEEDCFWAWPFEIGYEYGGLLPKNLKTGLQPINNDTKLGDLSRFKIGANTTLAIVATNAEITNNEAKRIAIMAHDGFARAIRPVHLPFDGDTAYALGTGEIKLNPDTERNIQISHIGSAAADCVSRAIARSVYEAAKTAM